MSSPQEILTCPLAEISKPAVILGGLEDVLQSGMLILPSLFNLPSVMVSQGSKNGMLGASVSLGVPVVICSPRGNGSQHVKMIYFLIISLGRFLICSFI